MIKKSNFLYTFTLGIVWEVIYALVITASGLLLSFLIGLF